MSLGLDKLTLEDRMVLAQSTGLLAIFEDPISFEIMDKAMMTPCGHSFSEDTINNWILKKSQCPLCNKTLKKSDVLPNYALRNAIARFLTAQAHLQQNIQNSLGNVSVSSEWTTPASPPTADEWKTEEGAPTTSDSKLLIEVISARDLKTDWFGNTDPYCVLEFQDQKRKTTVVHRNRCPAWGEVFVFNVVNMNSESNIVITVWDKDRILKDSFIGMVTVSMAEVVTTLKMVRRFVLQKKRVNSRKKICGDILLRIQFLDLRANYEFGRSTQSSMSPISSRVSTPPTGSPPTLSSPAPHQPPSPVPYNQAPSPPPPPPLPPHQPSPILPRRAHAYPPSPAPPSPSQPPRNVSQLRNPPSRIAPRNSLGLNRYGYSSGSSSDIASGSGASSSRVVRDGASGSGEVRLGTSSSEPIIFNNSLEEDSDSDSDRVVAGGSASVAANASSANPSVVGSGSGSNASGSVRSGSIGSGGVASPARNEVERAADADDEDDNEDEEEDNSEDNNQNNGNNNQNNNDDDDAADDNNNNGNVNGNFDNNEHDNENNNDGNNGEDNNNNNNNDPSENNADPQNGNENFENFENLDVDIRKDDLSNSRNISKPLFINSDALFSDDFLLPPPPPPPIEEPKLLHSSPYFFPTESELPPAPAPPSPSQIPHRILAQSADTSITHFISSEENSSIVSSPLSPSPSPASPINTSIKSSTNSPPPRKLDNDFAFTSVGLSPSSRKQVKTPVQVEPLQLQDFTFVANPTTTISTRTAEGTSTTTTRPRRDSSEIAQQMYEELHAMQFQLQLKDATPPSPNLAAIQLYGLEDEEESEEELTRERHRNNKPTLTPKTTTSQNNSPALRAASSPQLPLPLSISTPPQQLGFPPSPPISSANPHSAPTLRAHTKFNTAPLSTTPPPSHSPTLSSSPHATAHARRNSATTAHNNKPLSSSPHSSPHSSPRSSTPSSTHSSAQSTPSHSRNNSITNASIKNNRANSASRNQAAALSLDSHEAVVVPEPTIQLNVARTATPEIRVVVNEESVKSLMEMGFERDLAEFALKSCNNEMESALDKLLNNSGQLQFELLRSLLFT